MGNDGFTFAKVLLIKCLRKSAFEHKERGDIDVKNLLKTGQITRDELIAILRKVRGCHHRKFPHCSLSGVTVHLIEYNGLYVKYYFIETPSDVSAILISVHR